MSITTSLNIVNTKRLAEPLSFHKKELPPFPWWFLIRYQFLSLEWPLAVLQSSHSDFINSIIYLKYLIFKKVGHKAIMSKKSGGPGSPAFIEYKGTRFLIINQPSVSTMSNFIDVSYIHTMYIHTYYQYKL